MTRTYIFLRVPSRVVIKENEMNNFAAKTTSNFLIQNPVNKIPYSEFSTR